MLSQTLPSLIVSDCCRDVLLRAVAVQTSIRKKVGFVKSMLDIEGMETCNSVQIDRFWGHNFPTDGYDLACDVARKILTII